MHGWRQGRETLRRHPRFPQIVLAAALFGIFTTNVNISVLAVVIPRLVEDFDSTKTTITWVVTAPMLCFAVLGPAAGKLGDLYGRRRVFLVGLAGVAVFSGLTAASRNPAELIAFRTLAATFGASTAPAAMAIITSLFPRERRVQALGYWGLVLAGGPVLGMVVGGPVADAFGWRWLFIPQVPLALLGLAVAAYVLPETRSGARVRFDVAGSVLLGLCVGSLLVGMNRAPEWGWTHPAVLGLIALAPLAGWLFVAVERRTDHPMIPLEYFRRRNFAAPMVAQFFVNFAYQGGFVLVPLMLGEIYAYSSTRISLVTIARPLFYGVAGPVAGLLAVRLGERRTAVGGASLVAVSCLMLAVTHAGPTDLMIFSALALAGAGLGAMVPAMTATVTTAVDDADLGVAGATSQMMLQVGTVAGMQVQQTIQVARQPAVGLTTSYEQAFLVGAVMAVAGVFVASLIRSMVRQRPAPAATPAPDAVGAPAVAAAPAVAQTAAAPPGAATTRRAAVASGLSSRAWRRLRSRGAARARPAR